MEIDRSKEEIQRVAKLRKVQKKTEREFLQKTAMYLVGAARERGTPLRSAIPANPFSPAQTTLELRLGDFLTHISLRMNENWVKIWYLPAGQQLDKDSEPDLVIGWQGNIEKCTSDPPDVPELLRNKLNNVIGGKKRKTTWDNAKARAVTNVPLHSTPGITQRKIL